MSKRIKRNEEQPSKGNFLDRAMLTMPARLVPEKVAEELGFGARDIPVLVAAGLLNPVGEPFPQCVKYFFTADILALKFDAKWVANATNTIYRYNQQRNQKAKKNTPKKKPRPK